MDEVNSIKTLMSRMEKNLKECILPFWCNNMVDEKNGGFFGKVDGNLKPVEGYPKAVVLNTRMLWAFTSAFDIFGDEHYEKLAKRAFEYLRDYFWDNTYDGVYWMVNEKGIPLEIEKRTYGQAFIVYSMAEYYRVFKDENALDMAMRTFKLVNSCAKYENGGYADSVSREWKKDFWLWRWVMNADGAPKLLNSHLHMFEATITLYQATGNQYVGVVLKEFLEFLLDVAVDRDNHHLKAGMDEDGNRTDDEINYGHDAECCYLLTWAADLLGDGSLIKKARNTALDIMDHVYLEGLDPINGGMYSDMDLKTGHINKSKVWWTQAGGITSFFNCYELTKDQKYLKATLDIWDYVEAYVADHEKGEWFALGSNKVFDSEMVKDMEAMKNMVGDEKASKAKCPYHNTRTCLEIMKRGKRVLDKI